MSDYQARKARAMEMQREKEEEIRREMAAKAERQRLKAQEEEDREKKREAASKEARRQELIRANEELHRRAAGGSTNASSMDYDPFAEDMKPVISKSSVKVAAAKKPAGASSRPSGITPRAGASAASSSKPVASRNTGTTRNTSPPAQVLGRKEKAAKLFAQKAKKAAPADSLFSVRALVESHEPPAHRSSPSSGAGARHGLQKFLSGIDARQGGVAGGKAKGPGSAGTSTSGGSVRSQVAKNHVDGLRKLCPDRSTRDRRSIDEIQRDIKARKEGSSSSLGRGRDERAEKNGRDSRDGKAGSSKLASAAKVLPSRLEKQHITSPPAKRRRPSTPSESDYDSDSDSDQGRGRPAPRRPAKRSGEPNLQETLAELFGRGYQRQGRDYDSDGSDMEADLEEVRREERRAAALARKEDEEAERLEAKRKADKALKKQRLKGGQD